LLFGIPPFDSNNPNSRDLELEINKEVVRAKYKFPEDIHVTNEAKEFISRALQKDAVKRMTAIEALNHKWMRTTSPEPTSLIPRIDLAENAIQMLRQSINQSIDANVKNPEDVSEDDMDCGLEEVDTNIWKKQQ